MRCRPFKFTPAGGGIDVDVEKDGDHVVIRVADSGPGIPAGREKEIFSKYSRIQRNDQQNAGTGLGLAICQQLMGLLDGTVTFKTPEQGGAQFTLQCPDKH